jgi:hypothetical protein
MGPNLVAEQRERGYASQQPEFVLRRPMVIVSELVSGVASAPRAIVHAALTRPRSHCSVIVSLNCIWRGNIHPPRTNEKAAALRAALP